MISRYNFFVNFATVLHIAFMFQEEKVKVKSSFSKYAICHCVTMHQLLLTVPGQLCDRSIPDFTKEFLVLQIISARNLRRIVWNFKVLLRHFISLLIFF